MDNQQMVIWKEQNTKVRKIEDSLAQVKERFLLGCECEDKSCFHGLIPEKVYKHRLNIAELTKCDHEMYLMGVTMACLLNPEKTYRNKKRRRQRAQYMYQGRRVCLDAFVYLENCSYYQLKRIRKHVMTHGVARRRHGNLGKKPHNTFSSDIYKHANEFLKQYLETLTGETSITNTEQVIQLPLEVTKTKLHDAYKEYAQILEPASKLMGYSTFRYFIKEQFPNVKFLRVKPENADHTQSNTAEVQQENQQPQQEVVQHNSMEQNQTQVDEKRTGEEIQKSVVTGKEEQQVIPLEPIKTQAEVDEERTIEEIQKSVVTGEEEQQVIPLVVAQCNENGTVQYFQQAAFFVPPVIQLLPNDNIVSIQQAGYYVPANTTFSYQLTNTSYVINEQGDIVSTMANPPYIFNTM